MPRNPTRSSPLRSDTTPMLFYPELYGLEQASGGSFMLQKHHDIFARQFSRNKSEVNRSRIHSSDEIHNSIRPQRL